MFKLKYFEEDLGKLKKKLLIVTIWLFTFIVEAK